MDLLTFGLIALAAIVIYVVATHKKAEAVTESVAVNIPTVTEIAEKAEVVDAPAKAKKAPAKKAAPAKKPAAKKPAAKKPAAIKAPAKKPTKAKKA